ncbi:MAG: DUF3108 domain-containing protein [Acidobacteria bacterium]|nr:DUF3108 domain-containing protein [Acidobacteriota bacterium]
MWVLRSYLRILFCLLAIALSYSLTLQARQSGQLTPPPKPKQPATTANGNAENGSAGAPMIVGERISFNVSWSNFPTAANVEIEVAEEGRYFGQDSIQLKTKVETTGSVRSLFGAINNLYTSYVNPNSAIPHRIINAISQGQKVSESTIIIDQTKKQAIFPDDSTISFPSEIYDLPSLLFALRMRSWSENSKQKMSALYGRELIEMEIETKGRERISTQMGSYNTFCVKISPQKNLSRYRVQIWFSDDAQKLPVLITAKLPFGDVRAEMTSASLNFRTANTLVKLNGPGDESGGQSSASPESRHPFPVGEKLTYEVSWGNFMSVGRASVEVRQEGMFGSDRVYELFGEATSAGADRVLINVNDQIKSYALVDKLITVRSDLRIREGKRNKTLTATYDLKQNSATLANGVVIPIRPGTHDLLSFFYAVRAADLKIDSVYSFSILDVNNRLKLITVKVVKEEAISSTLGTRDCLQLDILTPGPSREAVAQVWLTNDSRKLPLYITTRTNFGELRFHLTGIANLK